MALPIVVRKDAEVAVARQCQVLIRFRPWM